jgi:uncharacterized membrane protein
MRALVTCMTFILILCTAVHAQTADYTLIIKENGEALVMLTIEGSGLFTVPLQSDVEDIKVRGALYTLENQAAELSIGSTEKAIMLYTTDTLTSKQGDTWALDFTLTDVDYTSVQLNMPSDVVIQDTDPQAYIEDSDFKRLIWHGSLSHVSVVYSYKEQPIPDVDDLGPMKDVHDTSSFPLLSAAIFVCLALIVVLALLVLGKKKPDTRSKAKQNIIKTLPPNEASIIGILMEHDGSARRNQIERISKIAKSSLASSLHNLENKKVIEVDRTYTTHFVKLTEWFKEL